MADDGFMFHFAVIHCRWLKLLLKHSPSLSPLHSSCACLQGWNLDTIRCWTFPSFWLRVRNGEVMDVITWRLLTLPSSPLSSSAFSPAASAVRPSIDIVAVEPWALNRVVSSSRSCIWKIKGIKLAWAESKPLRMIDGPVFSHLPTCTRRPVWERLCSNREKRWVVPVSWCGFCYCCDFTLQDTLMHSDSLRYQLQSQSTTARLSKGTLIGQCMKHRASKEINHRS